jgi:hypothetical protein
MKNPPANFPIRYAIVLSHGSKKHKDDLDVSKSKSLWSQFVDFLKQNPLEPTDLSIGYVTVTYSDKYNNKLCEIPLLRGERDWSKKLLDLLTNNIPEGRFSEGFGTYFHLTLFSYQGMMEAPIFSRILHGKNEEEISKSLRLKSFGYYSVEGLRKTVQIKYDKVMSGNSGFWQNFRLLNEPPVFYIQVPYSKLWEAIDRGKLQGVASYNEIDEGIYKDLKEEVEETFITIAIAKDLDALITEEIIAIYKSSNFCRMCGKVLPIGYKGIFCPDTKENTDCVKKRARIRKKKSK